MVNVSVDVLIDALACVYVTGTLHPPVDSVAAAGHRQAAARPLQGAAYP